MVIAVDACGKSCPSGAQRKNRGSPTKKVRKGARPQPPIVAFPRPKKKDRRSRANGKKQQLPLEVSKIAHKGHRSSHEVQFIERLENLVVFAPVRQRAY